MNPSQEGTIRLIDLVATLVRRRHWLYWFFGLGTLLGAVLLFLLPTLGLTVIRTEKDSVQARIQTVLIPEKFKDLAAFDYVNLTMNQITDPTLVAEVYEQTIPHPQGDLLDRARMEQTIQNFQAQAITTTPEKLTGSIRITIDSTPESRDSIQKFLVLLLQKARQTVTEQTAPSILATAKSFHDKALKGEPASQDEEVQAVRFLENLIGSQRYPFRLEHDPHWVREPGRLSRNMMLILFMAGSLLLGMVAAFVTEGVARTRKNVEDMELLRKAWKRE